MQLATELPSDCPSLKAGAYGMDFAAKFHVSHSWSVATPWPEEQAFAVTRLRSQSGMLDRTMQFDREQALVVSLSLNTIPRGNYGFWTEGKFREVCRKCWDSARGHFSVRIGGKRSFLLPIYEACFANA